MALEKTLDYAEHERQAGKLWRAREILASSLHTYGYEVRLYRALTAVLLEMGNLPEAGRFAFLAVESPTDEEQAAIDLFVARNEKNGVYHAFPANARLERVDDYPPFVQARLRDLGASERLRPEHPLCMADDEHAHSGRFRDAGSCGCFILLALFSLACMLYGAYTLIINIFHI